MPGAFAYSGFAAVSRRTAWRGRFGDRGRSERDRRVRGCRHLHRTRPRTAAQHRCLVVADWRARAHVPKGAPVRLRPRRGVDAHRRVPTIRSRAIDDVRLGVTTCYDLRFPELYRLFVDQGAEMFVIPTGWPAARLDHWQVLTRARAIENQVFLLGCNQVGTQEGVELGGHSVVIDPWGRVLAEGGTERRSHHGRARPGRSLRKPAPNSRCCATACSGCRDRGS